MRLLLYVAVTALLALTIGASTLISRTNVLMGTAHALPAGLFFLQAQDASGSPRGVMDVEDGAGRVTGFIQLNTPIMGKDSQRWSEGFTNRMHIIRLKNRATGQCLADSTSGDPFTFDKATLRPCSDETTLWEKIIVGHKVVLRAPTPRPSPIFWWPWGDYNVCPMDHPEAPGFVNVVGCEDDFLPGMFWEATAQPVGAVSSGLNIVTPPEVTPPQQPKNCKVIGSGGKCGAISFSCDPYSASDTIFAVTGQAGVAVTGGEPDIGLIVATYTNEGTDSVAICAKRAGLAVCATTINDVTFGSRVCINPSPVAPDCPDGEIHCRGACRPRGQCDFER